MVEDENEDGVVHTYNHQNFYFKLVEDDGAWGVYQYFDMFSVEGWFDEWFLSFFVFTFPLFDLIDIGVKVG